MLSLYGWADLIDRRHPMSRGEFGAQVGVPRLLKLFKENNIKTTFFIPGHTVDTFPEIIKAILMPGMKSLTMATIMKIRRW